MDLFSEEYYKKIQDRNEAEAEIRETLQAKFQSMGVRRKSVLTVSNDLAEIYSDVIDIKTEIEQLLDTPESDWDTLQTLIVDLRVRFWHLKGHLISARKPLDYLGEYCDKFLPDDEE